MLEKKGGHWRSDLHRVKGELLLMKGDSAAESSFHRALDLARAEKAKSLELRAAMSLSRLWRQQGKESEARQLLGEVYDWFTEGFDTQVLFFTLNREDFSFVIHLDRQPRTSRRREAQTGSRARSGSRSERTLDAVEHSRTLMEWWPDISSRWITD